MSLMKRADENIAKKKVQAREGIEPMQAPDQSVIDFKGGKTSYQSLMAKRGKMQQEVSVECRKSGNV